MDPNDYVEHLFSTTKWSKLFFIHKNTKWAQIQYADCSRRVHPNDCGDRLLIFHWQYNEVDICGFE